MRPRVSRCCRADGSSSDPSPGSAVAGGWQRIGKRPSPAPRPGSPSPTSASSPFKAQIAMEAVKGGHGIGVSGRIRRHPTMIHQWKKSLLKGEISDMRPRPINAPIGAPISLQIIGYVRPFNTKPAMPNRSVAWQSQSPDTRLLVGLEGSFASARVTYPVFSPHLRAASKS